MTWIPKYAKSAPPATQPKIATAKSTFAHSLEVPLVMSVRRLPAPVYATLMRIAGGGCTLRSLVLMDRGAEVEFDLGNAVTAAGRVHARRSAQHGARFEYDIVFSMRDSAADALARYVRELERRAAVARTEAAIAKLPTTDKRRGSYRALAGIPVSYRLENEAPREGRIGDISCTGIRLICGATMPIGTEMDLRFTLPSTVLDVYPEETAVIDVSGAAPRARVGRPDLRRPFETMALPGRIVTKFDSSLDGRELYGVSFVEIDGYEREEIARFTHAVQLAKLQR